MTDNSTICANSLFEQPWWLDIVASGNWEEVVLRDEKENVQGRIAVVHENGKVVMPKFTQTLGIWMDEEVKREYGKQKRLINELFEPLNRFKEITVRLSPENEYVLPFRWLGYAIEPRFTYRIENLRDSEKLYADFNKTAKKNIKYARNKVTLYYDADIDLLLHLLDRTFEAQKRKNPMDRELVARIVEACEENGHGKYIDARDKDGNVHSCAYFVYDENVFYYLFGASDGELKSSGAQSLVLWDAIRFASGKSKIFDFEGSMVEGIENFFRQFGGKCVPYYEINKKSLIKGIMDLAKPRVKKMMGYKI